MKKIALCLSCKDFKDCTTASKNHIKSKVIHCTNRMERVGK